MGHHHHHHHHHHGTENLKGKRLFLTILLNILITVAQIIGGVWSGSLSLLSDAAHNFSDVLALVISYLADKLSKRKYTAQQTYGFKRAEIIAALINASTLLVVAIFLGKEAIERFYQSETIHAPTVIVLAVLGILSNGGGLLLLKSETKDNLNMRSAYLHLFSDMMTSVAVLLGGILMYYFKIYWVDGVLTLIVVSYLLVSSWRLLLETLKVLMQFTPDHLSIDQIEKDISSLPEISRVHHVHLWQLNDQDIHFEAHVDFEKDLKLSEAGVILEKVSHLLWEKFKINHVLLQPEFDCGDNKGLIRDES